MLAVLVVATAGMFAIRTSLDKAHITLVYLLIVLAAGALSREDIVRRQEKGTPSARRTVDRVMACLSSDPALSRVLLRKASRIAGRLNSDWFCVYVQLPEERADRIDSTTQRHLVDNIQLAQSLGAEIVKLEGSDVTQTLIRVAAERGVTLAIVGETRRSRWYRLGRGSIVDRAARRAHRTRRARRFRGR